MTFIAEIFRWWLNVNKVMHKLDLYLFYLLHPSASQLQLISRYNLKGFYQSYIAIGSTYIVNIVHCIRFNMQ